MKKKLALIVISLDECFTQKGFSGGGHKVTKYLIEELIESNLFEIDIFCKKSSVDSIEGINSIKVLNKKTFLKDLKNEIENNNYDYILSSDILLPFGNLVIHSNSAEFKTKNGKNFIAEQILKIYNASKIKKQQYIFAHNDKHFFTVSENLKNDYVQSYKIDENRVFVAYPSIDSVKEPPILNQSSFFTIGSMAGGGLNKGGYLLLFAMRKFIKENNIKPDKFKARIIFPKIHKSSFYKKLAKVLGLDKYIELLPKQADMKAFYQSIDCYVLPSLNEAFGLVVPEAASNGRASIVSSTTGVSELVKDYETGFLFNRAKSPVKNLSNCLNKVSELYFNNFDKFKEISLNSCEITKKLDWKKFADTIISNMKEEKRD